MHKVLFVDDEPGILKALKRILRKEDYKIFYSDTVSKAMDILKDESIDLIVSDFMMPEMNGYEFLSKVRDLYPDITRIILSGYSEDKIVFKSIFNGVVKTFISKPWEDEYIKSYLKKIIKLKEELQNTDLEKYVKDINSLPSLPKIYNELNKAVSDDKPLPYMAKIIEKDPLISFKILQTVNSAFYNFKTTSLERAVSFMGIEAIRDIIICASAFNERAFNPEYHYFLEKLFDHAKVCSDLFMQIHEKFKFKRVDPKFSSCGLLAHIGYLIFMLNDFKSFKVFFTELKEYDKEDYHLLDKEFFKADHAQAGAFILDWWNIPWRTMEVVLFHHESGDKDDDKEIKEFLRIADVLAWKKLGFLENFDDSLYDDYK